MESELNEALTDAVRRLARPTTPDELKRRGVSRVRSLSLSRVAGLIDKAVNRTMIARTLGDGTEDMSEVSDHARQEFLAMLRGDDALARKSEQEVEAQARGALGRLKHELEERRAAVDEERRVLEEVSSETKEPDKELASRLRELFAAWGGSPENPSPLEREVIEFAVTEIRRERAVGSSARLEGQSKSIELLERRIGKLNHLLGETEAKLKLEQRRVSEDPGVPSVYDSVQGLDADDEMFGRKAELMASIFQANLAMRYGSGD